MNPGPLWPTRTSFGLSVQRAESQGCFRSMVRFFRELEVLVVISLLYSSRLVSKARGQCTMKHTSKDAHSRAVDSLASTAYPLANPKEGFSLLEDRGVVAGTCADEGWNYVLSFASDFRTDGWDKSAVKSHRTPGFAVELCGYGYMDFFDGARDHVMLDVGANMGLSLLPYYARGWRVIAFEPIPDNANTIRRNIFINGITEDRVALVHGAVTNMSGSLQVYAPRGRTDNASASRAGSTLNVREQNVDVFNVTAIEIDKYVEHAVSGSLRDDIMLVKIDTQGHELRVLRGMKRFLSNPPSTKDLGGWPFVVIAEYNPKLQTAAGHNPNEMLDFMRSLGYEVRCEMEDDRPIMPPDEPRCKDVIFSIGKPTRPRKE